MCRKRERLFAKEDIVNKDGEAITLADIKEGDILELIDQFGGLILHRENRLAYSVEEALTIADKLGYPVVLRPAFTLGGTGGGFAYSECQTANPESIIS